MTRDTTTDTEKLDAQLGKMRFPDDRQSTTTSMVPYQPKGDGLDEDDLELMAAELDISVDDVESVLYGDGSTSAPEDSPYQSGLSEDELQDMARDLGMSVQEVDKLMAMPASAFDDIPSIYDVPETTALQIVGENAKRGMYTFMAGFLGAGACRVFGMDPGYFTATMAAGGITMADDVGRILFKGTKINKVLRDDVGAFLGALGGMFAAYMI